MIRDRAKALAAHRKYNHSRKGELRGLRWKLSGHRKPHDKSYWASAKGKATRKRYISRPEVREHIRWMKRSLYSSKRLRATKL